MVGFPPDVYSPLGSFPRKHILSLQIHACFQRTRLRHCPSFLSVICARRATAGGAIVRHLLWFRVFWFCAVQINTHSYSLNRRGLGRGNHLCFRALPFSHVVSPALPLCWLATIAAGSTRDFCAPAHVAKRRLPGHRLHHERIVMHFILHPEFAAARVNYALPGLQLSTRT